MMLSPVSRPSSLSAAERPGAMLSTEPPPEGITKPFASMFLSSPCSWQPSQLLDQEATKVAGCGMQPTKGGGRHGPRLSEADVVKLLQSRADWLSCRVLHCCSVDLVVLKVRLSPGSDGMAEDPADPTCATSRLPGPAGWRGVTQRLATKLSAIEGRSPQYCLVALASHSTVRLSRDYRPMEQIPIQR